MEILTTSGIQSFKNCRQAYYYRTVCNLVPRIRKPYKDLGSAIHKGIETGCIDDALKLYENIFPISQEEADELEITKATIRSMLIGYWDRFGYEYPVHSENFESWNELKFEIPIINPKTKARSRTFVLGGKIDKLIRENQRYWLREYKTTGQVQKSYIDKLILDYQITTYFYGIQRQMNISLSGVDYRILRKPSIRPTKKENLEQFINRLEQDYISRPEFYFFKERLYRTQNDLVNFESELWDITQDMLKCRRDNLWYKNTSRCMDYGNCAYIPLCKGEAGEIAISDAMDLYEYREPNEELKEEESIDDAANF